MIHALAKVYSISPKEAGQLKEEDFWLMQGFEGFDKLRFDHDNPR